MRFEELLQSGKIRKETISAKEMRQVMERARRDLQTARKILLQDRDWSFAVAYNAALQASRAYMFSLGFRPAAAEGHKNTFAFMRLALGGEHEELITYFDRMRNKRNRAIYNVAGLITETEVRNLLAKAADFVKLIEDRLAEKRPEEAS